MSTAQKLKDDGYTILYWPIVRSYNPQTLGKLCVISFHYYHPQMKFAKVMFLHVSVILSTGGWVGGIPACIAGGAGLGGWYPSMPCNFPGPHPGGKLRDLARGRSRGPHPRGKLRGLAWGVSIPTPRGGFQAHTQMGSPGPCPGGVYPSKHWGRPPVGGMHPSGGHSCYLLWSFHI